MSYSIPSPYHPLFNPGADRPFECLAAGWQLIKDQDSPFFGMGLIVVLVSCLPFAGIIYGAWMCTRISILPE